METNYSNRGVSYVSPCAVDLRSSAYKYSRLLSQSLFPALAFRHEDDADSPGTKPRQRLFIQPWPRILKPDFGSHKAQISAQEIVTETPSFTPVVVFRAKDFHAMIGPEGMRRRRTQAHNLLVQKWGQHLLGRVLSRGGRQEIHISTESLVLENPPGLNSAGGGKKFTEFYPGTKRTLLVCHWCRALRTASYPGLSELSRWDFCVWEVYVLFFLLNSVAHWG